MTSEQKEQFGNYHANAGKVLSNDDATMLFGIYNDTFGTNVEVCRSCVGLVNQIIKKLKKLHDAS